MKTAARTLCKIIGITPPLKETVEELSDACFVLIDTDGSKTIEFEEFLTWILNDFEMLDFLLKYTGT